MKIRGFTIESTEIEIEDAAYEQARSNCRLDDELDVYLSDMDGSTYVVEEDGTVRAPYLDGGDEPADPMPTLAKILDLLPVRAIKDYVIHRQQREAEL